MFSLPSEVDVAGRSYEVRTDYRVILEILVMLDDPDLSDGDKTEALLRMFYVNQSPDPMAAVEAFRRFVDPRCEDKNLTSRNARLISWQQDFDLMVAPINHILGCEVRALDHLHWHTFLSAYLEIPPDSVFARVLRIREKLRQGKKLEKYEKQWYNRNRDLVHLKPKFSTKEEELIEAWT